MALESSGQICPVVGILGRCVEEANRVPRLQDYSSPLCNTSSKELGFRESACSGPECPPGFEDFIGVLGLSNEFKHSADQRKILSVRILEKRGMRLI